MALPSLQECAAALDRLAPALLVLAAGSVLVLGLAGLAALALRRASAAARHEVWVLAFAGVLLLPVLSAALPGWHVLPLPGAGRHAAAPADALFEVAALPSLESALAAPTLNVQPPPPSSITSTRTRETNMTTKSENPNAGPPQAATAAAPSAVPSRLNPPVSPSPGPAPVPAATPRRANGLAWTVWLLLCWPIGSLLVLGRVSLGHLSLWWLRRRRCARVTRGELFNQLQRLRGQLGVRRPVELLSCPGRTMPMTWGLWRARLLVPAEAAGWPAGQRRDVLLHELGHVKRWDCLTHLLSQVGCALYWFNPLAWVAGRRMQVERERACDDLVLNAGAEGPAYARHLLQSVSSSVPALRLAGVAAAAVAMARPSTLEERMRAILDHGLNRRGLSPRGTLAAVLLLLIAIVPAAVLRAQQAPTAQEPPPPADRDSARPTRAERGGPSDSAESAPATRPARPAPGAPRFGGGGRPAFGGGGFGAPAAPAVGEGPTCSFDATIYDVRIPVEQIGRLDIDALAKADSADAFEKALAALGTFKPMYRANQSVRLSGDTITIGSEVPIVTSSRVTNTGQNLNTITYQSTGAIFSIAGRSGAPGGGGGGGATDLDLHIEVSATSDGGAPISEKTSAPVMRKATMSHKGSFQPKKPFIVVSVDAGSADKDGKAVAYIGRVTMGEPQPPAGKGRE